MINQDIEKIIIKYLTNNATTSDLNRLSLWLRNPTNKILFNNYVKTNYAINYNMKQYNIDLAKKKLLVNVKKEKHIKQIALRMRFLKYAATLVVFLVIGYAYKNVILKKQNQLNIPKENVTLKQEDGNTKVLYKDELTLITNSKGGVIGNQKGNQLYYKKTNHNTLEYNTLTTPYGERFELHLSDGTIVNLNAGSSLKFPG